MTTHRKGFTHVICGEDLEYAPQIHQLLQVLMRWPEPMYIHQTLVVDSSGQKFSKRFGVSSIYTLKERLVFSNRLNCQRFLYEYSGAFRLNWLCRRFDLVRHSLSLRAQLLS